MGTSNLYVMVTLVETDGVLAVVSYLGKYYAVAMEFLDHIRDNTYSIATYYLPSSNG